MATSRTRLSRAGLGRGAGIGVAAVGALILCASPAAASISTSVDSPSASQTYTSNQALTVAGSATYANGDTGTLSVTITDPNRSVSPDGSDGCAFAAAASKNFSGSVFGSNTTQVSGSLDLSSAYPSSCSDYAGKPAVNGKWTVTVKAGGSTSSETFTVKVPPTAPADVKGASNAVLAATLTWKEDPETDTHAYAVLNGDGDVVSGPSDAGSVCSSGTCSATLTGLSQSGSQSFSIKAYRYTAPPASPTTNVSGDQTATSKAVTVNVMAKPVPTPSASPTPTAASTGSPVLGGGGGAGATESPSADASGGSTPAGQASAGSSSQGGGTATATPTVGASAGGRATPDPSATSSAGVLPGSGNGNDGSGIAASKGGKVTLGSTASSAEAAQLSGEFQTFAAPAGIDKLPPLPQLSSSGTVVGLPQPAAADDDGEPTDQGTFKLSLGYGPESKVIASQSVSTPLNSVADAIGISPVSLWRSLAGSLLLLLAAAHVRRWARKPLER